MKYLRYHFPSWVWISGYSTLRTQPSRGRYISSARSLRWHGPWLTATAQELSWAIPHVFGELCPPCPCHPDCFITRGDPKSSHTVVSQETTGAGAVSIRPQSSVFVGRAERRWWARQPLRLTYHGHSPSSPWRRGAFVAPFWVTAGWVNQQ